MSGEPEELDWFLPSIKGLGCAVWICDLHGRLLFVNDAAEELLDCEADECTGTACHLLVQSEDSEGQPICSPECEVRRSAAEGQRVEPYTCRLGGRNWRRGLAVIAFAPAMPEGAPRCLVHCALDIDRPMRAEEYLNRVASRSERGTNEDTPTISVLTRRELQVLGLLAKDEDCSRVAKELFISHVTVRNHIQHIVEKLAVHSTQEAVARYVLNRDRMLPPSRPWRKRDSSEAAHP